MKIAVVGGTGLTGSRIVPEAAQRGHQVTAISRHLRRDGPQRLFTVLRFTRNRSDAEQMLSGADLSSKCRQTTQEL